MTSISPQSTALVLLDLQTGNLDRLPEKEQLITNATSLLASCRKRCLTVAHVQVAFEEEDYQRLSPNNKAFFYLLSKGSAMEQGIHASLPHMRFHPNLTPLPEEIVVRKTRIGAFSTTDLYDQFQRRNITTLILAGVGTSGAVLSTVRDACDKDYAMTVVSDACADKESMIHDFLIKYILPKTCHILTTKEFIADIEGEAGKGSEQ